MSQHTDRVERLMIALAILGGAWAIAPELFVALARAIWRAL